MLAPLFFVRSRRITSGSLYNVGLYGYYNTSNMRTYSSTYFLYFGSAFVSLSSNDSRSYGNAVRCLVRPSHAYSLSFDATLGANAPTASAIIAEEDSYSFTLSSTLPTYENDQDYIFLGWNTNPDSTEPQYYYDYDTNSFTPSAITLNKGHQQETLYAIWGRRYVTNYAYTGDIQIFKAIYNGTYKIEAWGAQGGYNDVAYPGGLGGYTSGEIELSTGNTLYLYVGSMAIDSNGGYNGGGNGSGDYYGGSGATDIRLISGDWNDFDSLKSRIMVAGAGGGGYKYTKAGTSFAAIGGAAGGLNGYDTIARNTDISKGGSQTAGSIVGTNTISYGGFGYGGKGDGSGTDKAAPGSGSGYYGGGGRYDKRDSYSAGAGRSSFISGHNGCDAIDIASASGNIIHTSQADHYSGYTFNNTVMIDGMGYTWTDVKGTLTNMPTHDGTSTMIGNTGDGFIKITYMNSTE